MINVTYIDHMGSDLTTVNAARISFANESQELTDKDKKLIKYLADNDHMSPFEHNILTVMIECPLYIRSQIHRHRTFSYNEVSRRYTSENLEFYCPPIDDIRQQSKNNKQASDNNLEDEQADKAYYIMYDSMQDSLKTYNTLIDLGVSREQARGVLSQSLMTKFFMTGNLRNWSHFTKLREHIHAQKEVQYIAKKIKNILLEKFPESTKALFKE